MKKLVFLVFFFSVCGLHGQINEGGISLSKIIAARFLAARNKPIESDLKSLASGVFRNAPLDRARWSSQNELYKNLAKALNAAKASSDAEGYYTFYTRLPIELALRYLFLTQLHEYLQANNRNLFPPKGLLQDLVSMSVGKLLLLLDSVNLFSPDTAQLKLKQFNNAAISRALALADAAWPFAGLVKGQTIEDLSAFLKTYRDQYGYDKNVIARVLIPKDLQDNRILIKDGSVNYPLSQLMQKDSTSNSAYAQVTSAEMYEDFNVQLVYLFERNIPDKEKKELDKEFGVMVQKVGDEILATLETPPALLPRPKASTTQQAPPLYQRPKIAGVSDEQPAPQGRPNLLPRPTFTAQPLPAAPTDLLSQIRAGVNLKSVQPAKQTQGEATKNNGIAGALVGAMRVRNLPEEQEDVQASNDEDWDDETVLTQQPTQSVSTVGSFASVASSPTQPLASQTVSQAPIPQNLAGQLMQRLGQRRAVQALDEDDDQGDQDFWSDEE